MCGIACVINTKTENKETAKRIFKSILLANEERGKDSTGVLAIDREHEEFSLFKDIIPASKFLTRKKFRQTEADVWIGHTRLATLGDVNIRNAHPLRRGEIFIVHNGVISNHKELAKSLGYNYQVDSEVLIPMIKEEDWDLLQEIEGTANFIAWNKEKGLIHIERHDNPLYCAVLKELGILMFSSVSEVLDFIIGHYGYKEEVFEFKDNTLVTLNMKGELVGGKVSLKFKERYVNYGLAKYKDDDNKSSHYGRSYYDYDSYLEYMDKHEGEFSTVEGIDDDEYYGMGFCEVCGREITGDEEDCGYDEWGVPMCYTCMAEIKELEEEVNNGEKIERDDPRWDKFGGILKGYLI